MLEATGWFILGACAMLFVIILAGMIIAATNLGESALPDEHYVD